MSNPLDKLYDEIANWHHDNDGDSWNDLAVLIIDHADLIADVLKAADRLATRYEQWLADQHNADGSCKTTYIGDTLSQLNLNRIKKLKEAIAKGDK